MINMCTKSLLSASHQKNHLISPLNKEDGNFDLATSIVFDLNSDLDIHLNLTANQADLVKTSKTEARIPGALLFLVQ